MALQRQDYVTLIEDAYFARLRQADLAGLLACFTDDATVTVFHGDEPVQMFKASPADGEQPISRYYEYLFTHFDLDFGTFEHFVDTAKQRTASMFKVYLTPKGAGSATRMTFHNCNFIQCRDGTFERVTIYYAQPRETA